MFRIRRFGVLRTANVVALLYFVAFALLIVPIVLIMLATAPRGSFITGSIIGGALAALALYPLLGWVFTAIVCLIYNFVARWAGGIEIQVERVQPYGPAAAHGYPTAPYGGWQGPGQPGGTPPYGAPWSQGPGYQPPGYQPPGRPPGYQAPGSPPAQDQREGSPPEGSPPGRS